MIATIELCWNINEGQKQIIDEVEDVLNKTFNLPVKMFGKFSIADENYDSLRDQYLAAEIINQVKKLPLNSHYCLALVDVDLYAPGLNFVFGQANKLEMVAIVSLFRLKGERLVLRARTEAVHEVGHLLGLDHCSSPSCVMFFSNSIIDTDRKGEQLCLVCRRRLDGRL